MSWEEGYEERPARREWAGGRFSLGPRACAHLRRTFVPDLSVYSSGMGLNTPSLHSHHSPFSPHRSSPLNPLHYHFPSLSHLLFVLSSITSNAGTKGAEQKPRPQNRPITNINLKRCWSAESTFMHKDNLGSLFSLVPPTLLLSSSAGGFFMSCNELGFQLRKKRQRGWECNYPSAKASDSDGLKTPHWPLWERERWGCIHSCTSIKEHDRRTHTHTNDHTYKLTIGHAIIWQKAKRQITTILMPNQI